MYVNLRKSFADDVIMMMMMMMIIMCMAEPRLRILMDLFGKKVGYFELYNSNNVLWGQIS